MENTETVKICIAKFSYLSNGTIHRYIGIRDKEVHQRPKEYFGNNINFFINDILEDEEIENSKIRVTDQFSDNMNKRKAAQVLTRDERDDISDLIGRKHNYKFLIASNSA